MPAGKLLRESRGASSKGSAEQLEATVAWRAIAATKLPTLTSEDLSLFLALLKDTWPSLAVEKDANDDLEAALHQVLQSWQMTEVPEQARLLYLGLPRACLRIVAGPMFALSREEWQQSWAWPGMHVNSARSAD